MASKENSVKESAKEAQVTSNAKRSEKKQEKKPEPRYCDYCGGRLVSIGRDRANGSGMYDDWSSRRYHKKCWRMM
jgi:uncharacterized protein with PIN domain